MDCLEGECVAYVYTYEYACLSPMGWACIYSRCSTSWMVTRICSHGIFFVIIGIGFGKGYRMSSLFRIIFLPYWGIRFDDELLLSFFSY